MLIERADFADLDMLAAHRQRCWERQLEYVVANSPLHHRAWAGVSPPRSLDALADLLLTDKEMLRASQRTHPRRSATTSPRRRPRWCASTAPRAPPERQ